MNKRKLITVLVILALIGVAVWLILRAGKPKEIQPVSSNPVVKFPLKQGSTGWGVQQLQKHLNQKFNAGLKVDGDLGPKTKDAMVLHLKRDNISEDVFYKWNLDKI